MTWSRGSHSEFDPENLIDNRNTPEERERREAVLAKRRRQKIISATVPFEIWDWVRARAEQRGIPISWVAAELLKRGIEVTEIEEG